LNFRRKYYLWHWRNIRKFSDSFFPVFYSKQIKDIHTVAVFLGPYRNLTTITASLLSLHPNCQVLNHGRARVFGNSKINFLQHPSQDTINNFLKFACYASKYGRQGVYGGSITKSHAFKSESIKQLYFNRYPSKIKNNVRLLVWKDSHAITNYIRRNKIEVSNLLKNLPQLKFILPVRNPIDCAISNIRTKHDKFFGSKITNTIDCVDQIFSEFLFFLNLQKQFPQYFYHFFEQDIPLALPELIQLYNLRLDEQWLFDIKKCYIPVDKKYERAAFTKECISLVKQKFDKFPQFQQKLIQLIAS